MILGWLPPALAAPEVAVPAVLVLPPVVDAPHPATAAPRAMIARNREIRAAIAHCTPSCGRAFPVQVRNPSAAGNGCFWARIRAPLRTLSRETVGGPGNHPP